MNGFISGAPKCRDDSRLSLLIDARDQVCFLLGERRNHEPLLAVTPVTTC
jgi:hypothetical protein